MDLRDAAVLGVAEPTDQGDDIQAELVLGQDQPALPPWAQEPLRGKRLEN